MRRLFDQMGSWSQCNEKIKGDVTCSSNILVDWRACTATPLSGLSWLKGSLKTFATERTIFFFEQQSGESASFPRVHSHAPYIRSQRRTSVVFPDSNQWMSQKKRFLIIIQFLPLCIWDIPFASDRLWTNKELWYYSLLMALQLLRSPICFILQKFLHLELLHCQLFSFYFKNTYLSSATEYYGIL